jgi:hypothetical protein
MIHCDIKYLNRFIFQRSFNSTTQVIHFGTQRLLLTVSAKDASNGIMFQRPMDPIMQDVKEISDYFRNHSFWSGNTTTDMILSSSDSDLGFKYLIYVFSIPSNFNLAKSDWNKNSYEIRRSNRRES